MVDATPVYVLSFTYTDSSGKTVEIQETDLKRLGLPKETSDLESYNKNRELETLIVQYWNLNGKPIIREKLPNGDLSEPIRLPYIKEITQQLMITQGSLSNTTRHYSPSDIVYH